MREITTDQDLATEIAELLSLDSDLRMRGINVRAGRHEVQVVIDGHQYLVGVDEEWRKPRLITIDEGDEEQ